MKTLESCAIEFEEIYTDKKNNSEYLYDILYSFYDRHCSNCNFSAEELQEYIKVKHGSCNSEY